MIRIAAWFYAALALLALVLNAARGAPLVPLRGDDDLLAWTLLAVAAGLATVALSRFVEGRFAWARAMEETFRRTLGPLSGREVAFLALSSGIAEEMLFRGALQPALAGMLGSDLAGLLAATAAFAALHVGGRALWAWTVFAFALGLLLGWLFLASGSLVPPIVLHVLINGLNLRRITRPRPWAGGGQASASR